jgi:ditrans,polycis-polyprenyl diphosphate synthase
MAETLHWIMKSPPGEWATRKVNRLLLSSLQCGPVPKHIAFVMDGNRRYARHRRMETLEGHGQGFVTLARVLEMSYSLGVKVVTVYAFAVSNFQRSSHEVEGLLEMAKVKLQELTHEGEVLDRYGARVRVLGERSMIRDDVLAYVERAEEMTKHNTDAVLNICFPYGSREEITAAIRTTVEEYMSPPAPQRTMFSQSRISRGIMTRQASAVLPTIRDASPAPSSTSTEGRSSPTLGPGTPSPPKSRASDDNATPSLNTDNITVESLEKHMYTAGDPPVDLFIRTSGVERLSDFLTWQCHQGTYVAFAKCLWPDFGLFDFIPILLEWQWWQRQREKDQEAPLPWKKA